MSEKSKQVVLCWGCGSKWRLAAGKVSVIAELVECPLCEQTEGSV